MISSPDGFRKVSHPDQGVLSKVQESEPIEFWHPNFRQGHPELLYLVQRRVGTLLLHVHVHVHCVYTLSGVALLSILCSYISFILS